MAIYHTQAAYRGGHSTTEQMFTDKLMAEKAITSQNYWATLLMMDMSNAFDSIHRAIMLKDLELILLPDELHLIEIKLEDVKLAVRVGGEIGDSDHTLSN